jgi:hypothetical protein
MVEIGAIPSARHSMLIARTLPAMSSRSAPLFARGLMSASNDTMPSGVRTASRKDGRYPRTVYGRSYWEKRCIAILWVVGRIIYGAGQPETHGGKPRAEVAGNKCPAAVKPVSDIGV